MKPKILYVEDDLDTQFHVRALLEETGAYDVLTAPTASDALRLLAKNGDLKVIITDLNLPQSAREHSSGAIGLQLIETIHSTRPSVPIIVVSAFVESYAEHIFKFGASTLIEKSVGFSRKLLSEVSKAVEKSDLKRTTEQNEATALSEIRRLLIEELERYSSAKDRLIYIEDDRQYELIKPLIGFRKDIEAQLRRFPFQRNVFLMMKFRECNKDLSDYVIENLSKHGMRGIRADDDEWNITKNVYNPIAVLYCCKYGIALFDEPEEHQAYSSNVAYELGMMHYQNKHCLILRHASLPTMPFDLIKDLYVTYERDLQVKKLISSWINQVASKEDAQA